MVDLSDRTVLVTGAAGGLGSAMCHSFADAGARVIGVDRDWPKGTFDRIDCVSCDITDVPALDACLAGATNDGPIDTVINNAAIYPMRPFEEITQDEYRAVQAVNSEAPVSVMRALLPGMRKLGFGRVINITSVTLCGQWADLSAYVASKGTLLGLTRAWAREFGGAGITVNAISPGAIPTEAERIHPDPEGYNRHVLDRQAVKHRGSPRDIARMALFLAATENGFITGQTMHVDGGWTMQ